MSKDKPHREARKPKKSKKAAPAAAVKPAVHIPGQPATPQAH
jgi:hypothetical protein